jgi:hypothetical protein
MPGVKVFTLIPQWIMTWLNTLVPLLSDYPRLLNKVFKKNKEKDTVQRN